MRQNVFRNIYTQSSDLQNQYNGEEDRSMKKAAQMMYAIALVPIDDVIASFNTLCDELPEDFLLVADYWLLIR